MTLTTDQYYGLAKLEKWYQKYSKQIIEISGYIGTGVWDLVQEFIEHTSLDQREIMYLGYNQKQILELAYEKYHAYYIDSIVYHYDRIVDFNTIPILNHKSMKLEYEWKRKKRNKIKGNYRLIVVLDSLLMDYQMIEDLSSFGLPIILLKDPMLLPSPDSYTFTRDSNISLYDIHPIYAKSPLVYFAHKIIRNESFELGNYDTISVIAKKQLNLYNIKSSDINITISEPLMHQVNSVYREKILHRKDYVNSPRERVIVSDTLYGRRIVNQDNEKVRLYLTKGIVGIVSKINRHALNTKYVNIDFSPDFYHEPFMDLMIDRHHLNNLDLPSQQSIPDEIAKFNYAYAITSDMSRYSHWDKVTLIVDPNELGDPELQQQMVYTAITRAKKTLTIII